MKSLLARICIKVVRYHLRIAKQQIELSKRNPANCSFHLYLATVELLEADRAHKMMQEDLRCVIH